MNRSITILCFALVFCAAATGFAQVVKTAPGRKWQKDVRAAASLSKEVAEIETLMARGEFKKARSLAEKYIKSKTARDRDHALFLLGKTCYYMDDYDGAVDAFAALREEYGEGRFEREIAEFEFTIAAEYLRGRKRSFLGMAIVPASDEGLKLMRLVVERVPFSLRAQQAIMRMAEFYASAERYDEAKQEYAFLINNYKNSPYIEEAEFSVAVCLYRMNDGVPYDRGPLIEARDALKFYIQKYPNGKFVNEAELLSKEIVELLARKDLMVAEFYLRRGDSLSAKFYYRMAVNDYPGTRASEAARLRARTALR